MGRFWEQAMVHNREHCERVHCEPLHTHSMRQEAQRWCVYMCMCVYGICVWYQAIILCMLTAHNTFNTLCDVYNL